MSCMRVGVSRLHWLGTLRQWHWISSALCLVGMLMFALTGITLNHAAQIEARATVVEQLLVLPEELRQQLLQAEPAARPIQLSSLPPKLLQWLGTEAGVDLADRSVDWQHGELYLALPRPGGDAWLSIDIDNGEVIYERTDRGWISYFNDLHKGRNTGVAWSWFIDLFSVACVVFCITGLLLLQRHAQSRPMTWPVAGLGLVIPLLLALLLIH